MAVRPLIRRVARVVVSSAIPTTRWGDRLYSFSRFIYRQGRVPKNKSMFNDVLYHIKTTDEILDPLRVFVSDKEYLKIYVAAAVGDRYNVPTIAVLKDATEVARYNFPTSCCIKPTHASRRVVLRRNGEPIDRRSIAEWLNVNHYAFGREANYRSLRPKIIVEPLIFGGEDLKDYKFFCFRGEPRMVQVDVDRHTHHRRALLDTNWKMQNYSVGYPRSESTPARPENFEEMMRIARQLSQRFNFVRVDMYSDGKEVLVGEITHCHGNAGERFIPSDAEIAASRLIFGASDSPIEVLLNATGVKQ